jgi:hypothetical protein
MGHDARARSRQARDRARDSADRRLLAYLTPVNRLAGHGLGCHADTRPAAAGAPGAAAGGHQRAALVSLPTSLTKYRYSTQVQQATTNVARALETWHEPVNVTINGGLHSVLVSGIYAYNDPATNYPANISSVVYRDPEGSSSTSRVQVDFTTWKSGNFASPFGVYSLWSLYYGDQSTVGDGLNTSDPEPSVGPYVPNGSNPYHWYHGFTWVQRDTNSANGIWSPDWSFTSTGQQMSTP